MSQGEKALVCPRCGLGRMQAGEATYSGVHDGMLLSVPHMSSESCDVCGLLEFSVSALAQIGVLVGELNIGGANDRDNARLPSWDNDGDMDLPYTRLKQ